jgi:hypothetical protein
VKRTERVRGKRGEKNGKGKEEKKMKRKTKM